MNAQKGLVPLLMVVLISAALLGGYFIYQRQNVTSPQQIVQPSTPSPSDASREPTGSAETANWKTYTYKIHGDSKYHFQIKYPNNWDYREISAGNPLNLNFYTSSLDKLPRQLHDSSPADDFSLPQTFKRAPIEIIVSIGYVDRCPCENVTIAGLPAKKIILEHWEIIELVKDDYNFSIMRSLKDGVSVDRPLSTEKEIEIFNTMLSTFKFLDQN